MKLKVNYEDLEQNVLEWAEEKGIFDKGTIGGQTKKMGEETFEIVEALLEDDREKLIDAFGDTMVTLIILAEMKELDLVSCLEEAYQVIAKRTGAMVDGQFVKDGE